MVTVATANGKLQIVFGLLRASAGCPVAIEAEGKRDGFSVIPTNLGEATLAAAGVVRADKGLSPAERAFRSIKTVDLEIRIKQDQALAFSPEGNFGLKTRRTPDGQSALCGRRKGGRGWRE